MNFFILSLAGFGTRSSWSRILQSRAFSLGLFSTKVDNFFKRTSQRWGVLASEIDFCFFMLSLFIKYSFA